MEVVKELKQAESITFVASDGTKFQSAEQCMAHERELMVAESEKKAEELPNFELQPGFIQEYEKTWKWYYISTEEDLKHILQANFNEDSVAWETKWASDKYVWPCWLCIEIEDEFGNGNIVGTLESLVNGMAGFAELAEEKFRELSGGSWAGNEFLMRMKRFKNMQHNFDVNDIIMRLDDLEINASEQEIHQMADELRKLIDADIAEVWSQFADKAIANVKDDAVSSVETKQYDPVAEAYRILVAEHHSENATVDGYGVAVEEAIGYLGEALE